MSVCSLPKYQTDSNSDHHAHHLISAATCITAQSYYSTHHSQGPYSTIAGGMGIPERKTESASRSVSTAAHSRISARPMRHHAIWQDR